MGRLRANRAAAVAHSLIPCKSACHGPTRLRRGFRRRPRRRQCPDRAECCKLPLPCRAQRDVIRPNSRPPAQPRRPTIREQTDARDDRSRSGFRIRGRARARLFDTARAASIPAIPNCSSTDTFWPYFDRLRKEDPVHYCKDSMFGPYWSVTKYNDIMDIETNHAVFSSAASLGGITIRDVAARPAPRKLHRHGSAAPQRAAQDRGADVHADASRPARDQHPQALGRMPRQSAEERRVRLGRPGLDRTDHADAGRAVRLPLGGSPQADALVRRRNHASRSGWRGRDRRRAAGRTDGMREPISPSSGTSASTSRRRATCCR